jgi:hypothetical protein
LELGKLGNIILHADNGMAEFRKPESGSQTHVTQSDYGDFFQFLILQS